MSHTTPQTHIDALPPYRCYVVFHYKGKRQRIYNGKALEENCNPNYQSKLIDKKRELARLCQLVSQALKDGWYPGKETEVLPAAVYQATAVEEIQTVMLRFDRNGWADTYKRDMTRIASELITYLNLTHPLAHVSEIKPIHLAQFLDAYRSTGRYYMNKRRNLSALYKLLGPETNPVKATPIMRVTEQLNQAYTPDQLLPVLQHLKIHSPNLYLCALFTYGTLLRPHREVRLLRRNDFDAGLDFITLAGKATKSGRIRKVPVPQYIKDELVARNFHGSSQKSYVFATESEGPVNPDYFTTAWSRVKPDMMRLGLLTREQTLYSFRHSAAIYTFGLHQNLKVLQGLMGHSSPDVSLKYLRSLGIMDVSSPDDLPKLPT